MGESARAHINMTGFPATRTSTSVLLFFATSTATLNILDRSVLNIVAEPMRISLGLTDTQLGLLSVCFALFYSIAGLPIAHYADRPSTDRRLVVAACVSVWSAMTVLSGLASTFVQLLFARAFVAVGESGSGPALLTLLNEAVPERVRGKAFGIYGLGAPLGILLGLAVGGYLVELVGWRMTFVIVGAPGILVAVAFKIFVRDPRRMGPMDRLAHRARFDEALRVMLISKPLLLLTFAAATSGLITIGLPSWTAIYLIRILHLEPGHAGLILGLILGLGGIAGTMVGGILADRMERRGVGRSLLVPAAGLALGIPAALVAFGSEDWRVFTFFYGIVAFGAFFFMGPLVSTLHSLSPASCRATVTVILFMVMNLLGGGLGPFLIGAFSANLSTKHGPEGLRWVIMAASTAALVPALLYIWTSWVIKRQVSPSPLL
ncbi:MFS family permease [Sphingobium xenophagum]|uniref:MFS family permease n=1 Tax=Sphingobium xenophagum TaxID=121428 RepID=A0ABU1X2C4_SPHXE|nr:MFS transporter [Sphingobium xenophagum]MDR7155725.1 MFS family permease [Sphingobium xenophagum]